MTNPACICNITLRWRCRAGSPTWRRSYALRDEVQWSIAKCVFLQAGPWLHVRPTSLRGTLAICNWDAAFSQPRSQDGIVPLLHHLKLSAFSLAKTRCPCMNESLLPRAGITHCCLHMSAS